MKHKCHATGCEIETKPEKLMCLRHWNMVPKEIQGRVYSSYRNGQCKDKRPSTEFLMAAREAIDSVRTQEPDR